ncbi:hypothetical protein SDC9_116261 [bioreactor metagenome]|uniref:Uncharacterized protein n=1 Tax=bioreactor metagenome TaxID=1076179 RepID=A0A645BV23_9ZZZZ|nr:hypothetical protein [Candidatus Metalachnospira sp.]
MDRLKKRCIGAILFAFGMGMLIARLIPIWGCLAAVIIAAVGIYLLTDRC